MQGENKLIAGFAMTLGGAGIVLDLRALLGWSVQASGTSCKAICGLSMLLTELFGHRAGMWLGGLLWLAAGLALFALGWSVRKSRSA